MNIDRIKSRIIRKYGTKPTICYYYYLWDVVDYCGEKKVRESFDSIKNQGNEIIVGDYSSTDKTKELAKEYGFKVVIVKKDKDYAFNESKIRNAVIYKSKSNFLVDLNINVEYCKNFNSTILDWVGKEDIKTTRPIFRYKWKSPLEKIYTNENNRKKHSNHSYYGFAQVIYKPYLLYLRGYDETRTFSRGSQSYMMKILKNYFHIKPRPIHLDLEHKYHNDFKLPRLNKIFSESKRPDAKKIEKIYGLFNIGKFNEGRKLVKNSYW